MDTSPDVQIGPNGLILINGEEANYSGECRRTFYRTRDFIIKVDNGTTEAMNEIRTWDILDEEDRKHFVPILCGSVEEGWICQKYLQIDNPVMIEPKTYFRIWEEIIEPLCKKYGLWDVCGEYNWGLVDGIPMIYDYGE